MAVIVAALGIVVAMFGALGIVSPGRLVKLLSQLQPRTRFLVAVLFRIVIGAALLVAGGVTRFPAEVRALGLLALIAGIVLASLGTEVFDKLLQWWSRWPSSVVRFWSAVPFTIGAFLVYVSF
jgi:hypothetical protein